MDHCFTIDVQGKHFPAVGVLPPTTEKFATTQLQSRSQLLLFLRQSVMSSTQLREGQKTFVGKRMPTDEEWGNVTFLPARPSAEDAEEVKECPLTNKREK